MYMNRFAHGQNPSVSVRLRFFQAEKRIALAECPCGIGSFLGKLPTRQSAFARERKSHCEPWARETAVSPSNFSAGPAAAALRI